MIVLVCGSRGWTDKEYLFAALDNLHAVWGPITLVIHGGARGADTMGGEWAESKGIPVQVYPANWKKYGRAAGPIRNEQMLEHPPDMVAAFSLDTPGTEDMIRRALRAGIDAIVHRH